jgi:hypothetical protein
MTWTAKDTRISRKDTCKLLEMAEQGLIDWEKLARDALGWMSEADVGEFARSNDYITGSDEEDAPTDDDALDDFNYVGSRHHY